MGVDVTTAMGKSNLQTIFAQACRDIRQKDPEFDRLYYQVERENTPHTLGTGHGDPAVHAEGFHRWLKSNGVDPTSDGAKVASTTGENFFLSKWTIFFYFEEGT